MEIGRPKGDNLNYIGDRFNPRERRGWDSTRAIGSLLKRFGGVRFTHKCLLTRKIDRCPPKSTGNNAGFRSTSPRNWDPITADNEFYDTISASLRILF